jgi:hypothetical protein
MVYLFIYVVSSSGYTVSYDKRNGEYLIGSNDVIVSGTGIFYDVTHAHASRVLPRVILLS